MKKSSIFLTVAALAIAAFASCDKDGKTTNPRDLRTVSFSASILGAPDVTRAHGATWGTDRIGVTMLPAGETDYTKAHAANCCYTTTGDGKFVHASNIDAIYYPEEKSAVDFVAYYPHKKTTTAEYVIDLLDQTKPEQIDLMYSNNVKNVTEGVQALIFEHKLSKVVFKIAYPGGPTLSGVKVSLKDVPTAAAFHLIRNEIAEKVESKGTIAARVTGDASAATAEAIVIPGARTYTLQITLANGENVEEQVAADYAGGKTYTYPVNLSAPAPKGDLVAGTATITDWTDVSQPALNLTTTFAPTPDPSGERVTEFNFSTIFTADTQPIDVPVTDGVALAFETGAGTNQPKYFANGKAVRLYSKNVFRVTATDITKVEFSFISDTYSKLSTVTAGYTAPVWSGAAVGQIEFVSSDVTKDQSRFTAVKVTHK